MSDKNYKPVNITSTSQVGSSTKKIELAGILINSHTTGTFRLNNGTAGSLTPIGGTYTPASGSSSIVFEPIEFNSGCFISVGGTLDATLLIREIDDI